MTSEQTPSGDALSSYALSTCSQAAALSESLVGKLIAGDSKQSGGSDMGQRYVIWSPESANNDFGILIGDEYPEGLEGDGISKLVKLRDSNEKSNIVVPVDVKCFMPRTIHGTASWGVNLTPEQTRTCQAVIITTPKEPKFVALLPVYYLRQREKACHEAGTSYWFLGQRPLWTLHPLPAFPPELTPFVLPFSGLPQAMADARDYSMGSAIQWVNRYTNVTFVGAPRPDGFDVSVVQPDSQSFERALDEILDLYKAFARHSKRFRISFCDIRPMLGDFKIAHLQTGEFSHVEAKILHCEVVYNQDTGAYSLRHAQTCLPSPDRAVFTWKAPWDYLYSHVNSNSKNGPKQALFLPRDRTPKSWWNVPLSDKTVWLDWPADHPESFGEYLVNRTTDDRLVRDMERILTANPPRAQEPVEMVPLASDSLTEATTESKASASQSFLAEERWDTSSYRRGHGSAAHPELKGETYLVWASEVLLELCRQQGKGTVLDLGAGNLISRYWLVYYIWSEEDKRRYDQDKEPPCPVWRLDPRTPMVPINFLRLAWNHRLEPWCVRSSEYSANIITSRPASLVICDIFPYACARIPHGRFILPSESLRTIKYGRKFTLKEGVLDQYSVDCDEIVDSVLRFLDGSSQVTIGLCGRPIQTSIYVHYLQDVSQAVVAELAGMLGQEASDAGEERRGGARSDADDDGGAEEHDGIEEDSDAEVEGDSEDEGLGV